MAQQGGLGRGLSSLIPQKKEKQKEANYYGADVESGDVAAEKSQEPAEKIERDVVTAGGDDEKIADIALRSIMEVPVESVVPNPHQPRDDFNEENLQELANSIKEHGVLQPLVVTRKENDQYELIAGERRLEASKIAGLEKVPVIIKKANEQTKAELALIENVQRHDLNPIEEARAYKKLQDTFALTQDEIAQRVGKSRSSVSNELRLLQLPVEMQKAIVEGVITEGHARSILSFSNPEKQRALFDLIVKENLTVRQAEDKARTENPERKTTKKRNVDPDILQNEEKISEFLGTKVHIRKSKTGGQVVINYYSQEEFNSLVNKLTQTNSTQ